MSVFNHNTKIISHSVIHGESKLLFFSVLRFLRNDKQTFKTKLLLITDIHFRNKLRHLFSDW